MYTVYGKIKKLKRCPLAQLYLHDEDVDRGIVATRMISNFNAGHCFYDEQNGTAQSPGRTLTARLSRQWQSDLHAQRLPSRVAPHAVTAHMAFSYR